MSDTLYLIDEKNQLVAEGPVWDERAGLLYTIDILGRTIRTTRLDTLEHSERHYPQDIGCVVLRENGGLLAAMQDGIYEALPDGSIKPYFIPDAIKGRRFNDGKVGPDGRLYVGTTDENHEGAFYRLDPNGTWTTLLDHIGCSNGLAWSADHKTLYYVDSPDRVIYAFDFDEQEGMIANRRTLIGVPFAPAVPDGMTIDADDMLYLALWGGHCVLRINPRAARVERLFSIPASKVSCCGFAGDDLKTLVITTASKDVDPAAEPDAGKTFALRCETPGAPSWRFKG